MLGGQNMELEYSIEIISYRNGSLLPYFIYLLFNEGLQQSVNINNNKRSIR